MRGSLIATAFALASLAAAVPAHAQTAAQQGVIDACARPGASGAACQAAIKAYFAALQAAGITPSALEQAVADLVVALAESPDVATTEVRAVVADALETIANTYATPAQATEILAVAAQVDAGTPPANVVIPVSSSPA